MRCSYGFVKYFLPVRLENWLVLIKALRGSGKMLNAVIISHLAPSVFLTLYVYTHIADRRY
jgi:hypothetical protein